MPQTGISRTLNNYQHFSVVNGLSGNDITQISKHSSGLIFIATQNGLNRFDGKNFRNYKAVGTFNHGARFTNDYINLMKEDMQGQYWIITKDKRLYRFDPNKEKNAEINLIDADLNPVYNFTNVYLLPGGQIWLQSLRQGAFRITLDKDTFKYKRFDKSCGLADDNIRTISGDSNGNVWILSHMGLSYLSKKENTLKKIILPDISQAVTAISIHDNKVLIGNQNGYILDFNKNSGRVTIISKPFNSPVNEIEIAQDKKYFASTSKTEGLFIGDAENGNMIKRHNQFLGEGSGLYFDKYGIVWLIPRKPQIISYNLKNKETTFINGRFQQNDDISLNSDFIETPDNRLLIRLCNGEVYFFDRKIQKFSELTNPADNQVGYLNNVRNWFLDNQNILWYNTNSGGLNKLDISPDHYSVLKKVSKDIPLGDVRTVIQDSDGNIWIGQKEGRLFLFDSNLNYIGSLTNNGTLKANAIFYKNGVYAINEDSEKNIWVGTRGDGLYKIKKTKKGYQTEHFYQSAEENYSINSNHIYAIQNGINNEMIIGTWGGGVNILTKGTNGYFFHNQNNTLSQFPAEYSKIRSVAVDHQGRIWAAGQHNGILCIARNKANPVYTTYKAGNKDYPLPSDDVRSLFITPNKRLYIGTNDAGMAEFDLSQKDQLSLKLYNNENLLSSNSVQGFVTDNQGGLWIPTYTGVLKINYLNSEAELFYPNEMSQTSYSSNSICYTKSNKLIVGNKNGIIILNPNLGQKKKFIPELIFNQLKVNNQSILPNDNSGILKEELNKTSSITLKHSQSVFDIECIALDYRQPSNIQYAFMLEGIDHSWTYHRNNNIASFKGIPAGKYTLRVKSTDSNGIWMNNERSIQIKILNPYYKTGLAYFIYFILFLVLLFIILRVMKTIFALRSKIEIEKSISEQKINFFTVISHELRTPLTLIHAPLENILTAQQTVDEIKREVAIAAKNSKRLIKLVNQLLDFRALQFGKVSVRAQKIVVANLLESLIDNFSNVAQQKNIELEFRCDCKNSQIISDRDKLETIFFNLISNAFKFTPAGKKVTVTLYRIGQLIHCEVSDEGIGMTKEVLQNIYKPFHTSGRSTSDLQTSSGIGLSIVKEYCDLLKIVIEVESIPGLGTTFRIKLKAEDEIVEDLQELFIPESTKDAVNDININDIHKSKRILIIEDNAEMREYLVSKLVSKYNVICARDGIEGMELAQHGNPDLIITDILMPNKTGEEFVAEYRRDIKTSHIPIIVISAIDNEETKERLTQMGIEDYLVKPFVINMLISKIENLFEQRRKLQMLYSSGLSNIVNDECKLNEQDKIFVEKLNEFMMIHLEDSEISVNDLSKLFNIPYHILNNKVKQLLDLTPIEYIREFRMQKAAELIRTTSFSIKEITYQVGINDQRYFSRCFRERFGVSPTQYKDEFHV